MSTQRPRIRLVFAALMIVGSIVGLVEGHVSTFQVVLYLFALGLGLFLAAQAVHAQPRK
jgi:hydrogenase/urease accessory protein HupE